MNNKSVNKNACEKKVRKTGFTLIELLVTIAVLSIIFVVGFYTINGLFGESENMAGSITRRNILETAEVYAMEFRDSDAWKEEVEQIDDKEEVDFCVKVASLVNYGYFKKDNLSDDIFNSSVGIKINNGVYTYSFIESTDNCRYLEYETDLVGATEGEINIDQIKSGSGLSTVDYNVKKINNNTYTLSIGGNFKFNVSDLNNSIPTYISVVIDDSMSMMCNGESLMYVYNGVDCFLDSNTQKYVCGDDEISKEDFDKTLVTNVKCLPGMENDNYSFAINAAKTLYELIDNKIDYAYMSGVKYARYITYSSGFVKDASDINFGSCNGIGTNTSVGLDYISYLLYTQEKENINISNSSNIYTILLYDGISNQFSKFGDNSSSELIVKNNYEGINNYLEQIGNNMKGFYKENGQIGYTVDSTKNVNTCNRSATVTDCLSNSEFNKSYSCCVSAAENSAKILKNKYNSKLIVIGYNFGNVNSDKYTADQINAMKKIASTEDEVEFCSNDTFLPGYCYYESNSSDINTLFTKISDSIVRKVSSTNVSKVDIILSPKTDIFNEVNEEKIITSVELRDDDVGEKNVNLSNINYELTFKDSIKKEEYDNAEIELFEIIIKLYDEKGDFLGSHIVNGPKIKLSFVEITTVN